MPASSAALVAASASSTRSMRSLSSTLVAPPTRMTATRPVSRAIRRSRMSWSASMLRPARAAPPAARSARRRRLGSPRAADDGRVVLGGGDPVARPEVCPGRSPTARCRCPSRSTCPPSATARSSSSATRRCPKPGARTTTDCIVLCMLPPTSSCSAGAVDVLGEHHQRPVRALGHLDGRHDLLHLADLLVGQQDQRVVEDRFHPLVVGDHVAGDVAVVELDPVDDVDRQPERRRSPRW